MNLEQFILQKSGSTAFGSLELKRNAGALGEAAHRLHKREIFVFADEGENIPPFMAPETIEDLAMRVDVEAWALLAMKGAKRNEVGPGAFQGENGAYYVHDIARGANLFQR